jgi:hypothetical protein
MRLSSLFSDEIRIKRTSISQLQRSYVSSDQAVDQHLTHLPSIHLQHKPQRT